MINKEISHKEERPVYGGMVPSPDGKLYPAVEKGLEWGYEDDKGWHKVETFGTVGLKIGPNYIWHPIVARKTESGPEFGCYDQEGNWHPQEKADNSIDKVEFGHYSKDGKWHPYEKLPSWPY